MLQRLLSNIDVIYSTSKVDLFGGDSPGKFNRSNPSLNSWFVDLRERLSRGDAHVAETQIYKLLHMKSTIFNKSQLHYNI